MRDCLLCPPDEKQLIILSRSCREYMSVNKERSDLKVHYIDWCRWMAHIRFALEFSNHFHLHFLDTWTATIKTSARELNGTSSSTRSIAISCSCARAFSAAAIESFVHFHPISNLLSFPSLCADASEVYIPVIRISLLFHLQERTNRLTCEEEREKSHQSEVTHKSKRDIH